MGIAALPIALAAASSGAKVYGARKGQKEAQKQNEIKAIQTAWSPWTGKTPQEYTAKPSMLAAGIGGAVEGAQIGSDIANWSDIRKLNAEKIKKAAAEATTAEKAAKGIGQTASTVANVGKSLASTQEPQLKIGQGMWSAKVPYNPVKKYDEWGNELDEYGLPINTQPTSYAMR